MIRVFTSEELERDQAAQRLAAALTSFFILWPDASREAALGHSAVANSLSNLLLSSRRAARSVSAPPTTSIPQPQVAEASTVSADSVAERLSRLSFRSRSRNAARNNRVRSSTFGRSYSPAARSSQDQLSPSRRIQQDVDNRLRQQHRPAVQHGGTVEGASYYQRPDAGAD